MREMETNRSEAPYWDQGRIEEIVREIGGSVERYSVDPETVRNIQIPKDLKLTDEGIARILSQVDFLDENLKEPDVTVDQGMIEAAEQICAKSGAIIEAVPDIKLKSKFRAFVDKTLDTAGQTVMSVSPKKAATLAFIPLIAAACTPGGVISPVISIPDGDPRKPTATLVSPVPTETAKATEIVVESTYKTIEVYGEPVVHNVELGGEKVDISLVMDKSYAESPSHPVEKIDLVGNGPTHLAKGMLEMLWGMDKSKEGMDLWETLKAVQAGEESPEALTVTIQIEDPALSGVQAVDKKLKLFPDLDPNAETDPVDSLRLVLVNAETWYKDISVDTDTLTRISKGQDAPRYYGTTLRYNTETGVIDLLVSPTRKYAAGPAYGPAVVNYINISDYFLVEYGIRLTYPTVDLQKEDIYGSPPLLNEGEIIITKGAK